MDMECLHQRISQGDMLGMTHINAPELIRTPLGGYINHSMNPNCMRIQKEISGIFNYTDIRGRGNNTDVQGI